MVNRLSCERCCKLTDMKPAPSPYFSQNKRFMLNSLMAHDGNMAWPWQRWLLINIPESWKSGSHGSAEKWIEVRFLKILCSKINPIITFFKKKNYFYFNLYALINKPPWRSPQKMNRQQNLPNLIRWPKTSQYFTYFFYFPVFCRIRGFNSISPRIIYILTRNNASLAP